MHVEDHSIGLNILVFPLMTPGSLIRCGPLIVSESQAAMQVDKCRKNVIQKAMRVSFGSDDAHGSATTTVWFSLQDDKCAFPSKDVISLAANPKAEGAFKTGEA